jgi:alginate O-acetyltransferase complex protein AlgI
LSNWFRDYLYIPLGGNKLGALRTRFNLIIVFFLCGLWHGASWNFVLWGLFHGLFLILERGKFGEILRKLPFFVRNIYVILVVVNAWVFFRLENFADALSFFQVMYGFGQSDILHPFIVIKMDLLFSCSFALAILFCMPLYPFLERIYHYKEMHPVVANGLALVRIGFFSVLLLYSITHLAVGSYNPFIYFRF